MDSGGCFAELFPVYQLAAWAITGHPLAASKLQRFSISIKTPALLRE